MVQNSWYRCGPALAPPASTAHMFHALLIIAICAFSFSPLQAAKATASSKASRTKKSLTAAKPSSRSASAKRRNSVRKPVYSPWKEPTYADSTASDQLGGDDPVVRRAAVEALGPLNGSVVVTDADSGRILTIVNQKLAYKPGFTPCSTIKPFVGMAGLTEGLVERDTVVKINRWTEFNLTDAMAKSDNAYFALLGQRLGFERVSYHAKLFGLGEHATVGIDEERPGSLPRVPPANGGVGMMSSFGEGIRMSPLQLAAAMGAVANGGTLYYLQYPQSRDQADRFVPRVKRQIEMQPILGEIKPGLVAAVDHGTARLANVSQEETILGKTGTCTDQWSPTHLGWFGSFNDSQLNRIAVVVLLTGGKPINGPVAANVAGKVYRSLTAAGYFQQARPTSPVALVGQRQCCLE